MRRKEKKVNVLKMVREDKFYFFHYALIKEIEESDLRISILI